ncbi:MAG: NAD-binding protein [Candidatus Aminicenantales bacterium]
MDNRRRIYISLIVFAAVYLVGVVGFKFFGGPETSLLESVYMTAITISTIGYGEVVDLSHSPAGRVFTILFIVLSLGTIAFAVSSITAFIVEGELKNLLGRRRMEKDIAKLKDHYIVCGSDETAQTVIRELILTERDFVVIEPSKEGIDRLATLGGFLYMLGDPAEDEILEKAGVRRAKGILLSLPSDEVNLFVTITARSLNPTARIVAKGTDLKSHGKIKKAGADSVVSPSFIGGMRMVSDMVRPAVVTFLDKMLYGKDRVLRVEEFGVGKESPLVGKTISDSAVRERTGALLVAVRKGKTGDYEFNPAPDRIIQENDIFIFIGSPEMLKMLDGIAANT